MKKRICPICDQSMDHPFYCRTCRRLRFHTQIQEISYYLNERHPEGEKDCLYHGTGETAAAQNGKSTAAVRTKQENQKKAGEKPVRNRTGMGAAGNRPRTGVRTETYGTRTRKKNPARIIVFAVLIYILIMVCVNVIPAVLEGAAGAFSHGIPETAYAPEAEEWYIDDEGSVYLSDEEVKEAGEACSSYGHLPVTSDRLEEAVEASREILGWDQLSSGRWSSNYVSGDYTDYTDTFVYDLYSGETLCGTIEGYFDTATGEMHGIAMRFFDMDSLMAASDAVRPALEEAGCLSPETDLRALLDAALEESRRQAEEDGTEDTDLAVFQADSLGAVYYRYDWEGESSHELNLWAENNPDSAEQE